MNDITANKSYMGFWVYLMTDLLMFGGLFAAFAVLRGNTFGGPTGKEIFNMPYILTETLILLTSSFTCGLAVLFATLKDKKKTIIFLSLTFLLGLSFLGMELSEFAHLFQEGASFQRSAFLSSYFSLVGMHGLHITAGLLWLIILSFPLLRSGLTEGLTRKVMLFGLFWHFLDIVWIFIFTFVYLQTSLL